MATDNPLSYVDPDFDAIVQGLVDRLKVKNSWKDTYESSTGQMLIEFAAYVGNLVLFNLQRRAEECHISTAQNLSSVINIVKLLNYSPKRKTSSVGTLRFTLSGILDKIVYIPKYTKCQTADGTIFLTNEHVAILVGNTFVDALAVQGDLVTLNYISDGTLDQRLIINDIFVENSASATNPTLRVYVGGEEWTKVSSFILSENASKHYRVEVDLDSTVNIIFGNNVKGKIPPSGSQVVVTYVKSDGIDGNVYQTDMVTTLNSTIRNENDEVVSTISVTNTTSFLGGDEAEDIEEIRYEAPRVFSTGERAVTKSDFIAILENYAGVVVANVWGELEVAELAGTTADLNSLNKIYISLLLQEWILPSDAFKTTLSTYLRTLSMLAVKYEFVDPAIIYIIPVIDLTVASGFSLSETQDEVSTELLACFALGDTTKLGEMIKYSNVLSRIDNLDSVSHLNMHFDIRQVLEAEYSSNSALGTTLLMTEVLPGSIGVYVGEDLIANDNDQEDGTGIFVFTASGYSGSGTIDYTTGLVEIDIDGIPEGEEVSVRYQQNEDRNLVVNFNEICKLYSVVWNSITIESN
jgi:hypothetical protein